MVRDELVEIIEVCLDIDKKAFESYLTLSELSKNNKLITFWKHMSAEEEEHIEFWDKLLILAKENMIPQIFNDPKKIKLELEINRNRVSELFKSIGNTYDISKSFLIALGLEFYLMHPAFEMLFHFIKTFDNKKNPEDEYEHHINEFIEALSKYGKVTLEMELLGESLQRLWKENRLLSTQASVDELTGVLNRRGFFNNIKPLGHLALRNKSYVGVIMIDIDHFKKINDTYGHRKGDEILAIVANTLKNEIRTSDSIGRYGGEEFIIFLSSIDQNSVYTFAEKIRKHVELKNHDDIKVTISIGISHGNLKENVEKEIMTLINKADSCLYEAKRTGRNKVVVCD